MSKSGAVVATINAPAKRIKGAGELDYYQSPTYRSLVAATAARKAGQHLKAARLQREAMAAVDAGLLEAFRCDNVERLYD